MEGSQIKMEPLFAVTPGSNGGTDMIVTLVFELDVPSEIRLPIVPFDGATQNCETRTFLRTEWFFVYLSHSDE
jgi:hypothetical protein